MIQRVSHLPRTFHMGGEQPTREVFMNSLFCVLKHAFTATMQARLFAFIGFIFLGCVSDFTVGNTDMSQDEVSDFANLGAMDTDAETEGINSRQDGMEKTEAGAEASPVSVDFLNPCSENDDALTLSGRKDLDTYKVYPRPDGEKYIIDMIADSVSLQTGNAANDWSVALGDGAFSNPVAYNSVSAEAVVRDDGLLVDYVKGDQLHLTKLNTLGETVFDIDLSAQLSLSPGAYNLVTALTADQTGDVYVGISTTEEDVHTDFPLARFFPKMARFSPDGALVWQKAWDDVHFIPRHIVIAPDGDVVVTGPSTFGNAQVGLWRLNATGERTFRNIFVEVADRYNSMEWGVFAEPFADAAGTLHIVGYFDGKTMIVDGGGTTIAINLERDDYAPGFFITQLNDDFEFVWTKVFDDPNGDNRPYAPPKYFMTGNTIHLHGYFADRMVFDLSNGTSVLLQHGGWGRYWLTLNPVDGAITSANMIPEWLNSSEWDAMYTYVSSYSQLVTLLCPEQSDEAEDSLQCTEFSYCQP